MQKRALIIAITGAVLLGIVALSVIIRASKPKTPPAEQAAVSLAKPGAVYNMASKRLAAGDDDGAARYYEQFLEEFPDSDLGKKACFTLASIYEKRGELLKARNAYRRTLEEFPSAEYIEEAKKKYEDLNIKILFSKVKSPESFIYEVKKGDTLGRLAKEFDTTIGLISRTNGLKSDLIRIGQKLKVTKMKFSVVVDKSQNILSLKGDGNVIKTYKVSTGINDSTPMGEFKIVTKVKDPTWYKEGAVVPPGSPNNILGSRWMGISEPGYGIHGSRDPKSIGKHVTAGCVRMLNDEVEELYTVVPSGTEVVIVE
ncbi:L,D-transpeptidase family protein [Candidatus Omnitrophota bacterium]